MAPTTASSGGPTRTASHARASQATLVRCQAKRSVRRAKDAPIGVGPRPAAKSGRSKSRSPNAECSRASKHSVPDVIHAAIRQSSIRLRMVV